jgi:hypothetical protein
MLRVRVVALYVWFFTTNHCTINLFLNSKTYKCEADINAKFSVDIVQTGILCTVEEIESRITDI